MKAALRSSGLDDPPPDARKADQAAATESKCRPITASMNWSMAASSSPHRSFAFPPSKGIAFAISSGSAGLRSFQVGVSGRAARTSSWLWKTLAQALALS